MTRALGPVLLAFALACRRDAGPAVSATGTIEMREVDAAPLVPARVVRVLVDEGAAVRTGDTLAVLTQSTTRADLAQREAVVGAAEAALREAVAGARPGEIDRARADVRTAEAEAVRTAAELARVEPLARSGTVSRQALDDARAAAEAAGSRRDAAREALRLLEEGTRPERIQAARAELASARAGLAAAQAVAGDLVLVAAVDGVVISRQAEPGEMLGAGQAALTLGEVAEPYVRVYLPTRSLPLVRNGQAATAILDGFPDRPIPGRVVAISPQAEFTPRVAMTERERADLVFGVKVALWDTTGLVRPGLPATVHFPVEAAR
jgi:HlyD family secretion protein